MAGAGQRVGTIQPGLVVTPSVEGPTAQEGIAAMQQAFKAGILNYDDILDGLTVKPAARKAEMGDLEAKIKKQKADEENRPLREQLDKLKLEAETADAGVAAGISRSRADVFAANPSLTARMGSQLAEGEALTVDGKLYDARAANRKAHELANDPEGLKHYYTTEIMKMGGIVPRPGMSLDELKVQFQQEQNSAMDRAVEKMQLESYLKSAAARGDNVEKVEADLRDKLESNTATQTYRKVAPQAEYVRFLGSKLRSGEEITAAEDMSLIYAFMKLQDPGSAVREGEYASAEKTRGLFQNIWMLYNNARDGQKLDDKQRVNFVNAAQNTIFPHVSAYSRQRDFYSKLAKDKGIDPWKVIGTDSDELVRTRPAGKAWGKSGPAVPGEIDASSPDRGPEPPPAATWAPTVKEREAAVSSAKKPGAVATELAPKQVVRKVGDELQIWEPVPGGKAWRRVK